MSTIFYMIWTIIIFIDLFQTVDLQFGVYGPPPMFPPPLYPPPPPILPMPAPMPMMSPFLIPIDKSSSEVKNRNNTSTTTTTTKKPKKREYALAFPMPMAMPLTFVKPKPSNKPKAIKPKKAFAIPMPMMAPAPVVAPPPVILAPFPPQFPRPRRPRRMRPRPGWLSGSSVSSESTDISSCDSSYPRHRRYRQRRGKHIYRRNLWSSEHDNEIIKPMLSYITGNGDVKFETKISNDDVAELLGEREIVDKRSESVQVLTRGAANKPQIVVVSNSDGIQNYREGRVKQVNLKSGVSNHVLREGKKELIFSAPDNKKISNLSLSFQIN